MNEVNGLLIDEVVKENTLEYNLMKYLEESAELNEVVIKTLTKGQINYKPPIEKLHEEISHVEFRLAVLKRIYGEDACNAQLNMKQVSIANRMLQKKRNNL